jgi:hypothetical protein
MRGHMDLKKKGFMEYLLVMFRDKGNEFSVRKNDVGFILPTEIKFLESLSHMQNSYIVEWIDLSQELCR